MTSRDLLIGQKLDVQTGARGAKYIMSIDGKKKYFSASALLKHQAKADRLERELCGYPGLLHRKRELPVACHTAHLERSIGEHRVADLPLTQDHLEGHKEDDPEEPSRWQVFTGARGGSYTVINGKKRYLKSVRPVHPQMSLPSGEEQEQSEQEE
jgi:hypothetical protein